VRRGGTLVVLGILGSMPFAGVAWQVLHFMEGFRRLGHDVYYLEDTQAWPYDGDANTITDDCRFTLAYISRLMAWCGFADRWAYRSPVERNCFGLSESDVSAILRSADALINLTGATVLTDGYLRVPVRVYLETDPVLPQVEAATGRTRTLELLGAHTHHFTFGENLGAPDCLVPQSPFAYQPTRQPVVLDWWFAPGSTLGSAARGAFTTVANWQQTGKDLEWRGETYTWSKHHEFLKLLDLPRHTSQPLELALACSDLEVLELLTAHGWQLVDAMPLSRHILPYRTYIWGSRGEFTVAKDQNVRLRSGWFSDRSACYLAAGLPVVTQDTAFGNVLPTGRGLFAFRSMADILDAFDRINSNYAVHSSAAREVAVEYFGAERVLAQLLDRCL
jgi:hypothetical protein